MAALVWGRDPGRRFRGRHDMAGLLRAGARHFPCLAPIARVGPVTAQPSLGGPWALARTPLQLALENSLLLGPGGRSWAPAEIIDYGSGLPRAGNPALGRANALDADALRRLLVLQLGSPFGGRVAGLGGHRGALAVALAAHGLDRRDEALRLLDSLSLGWDPRRPRVDRRLAGATLASLAPRGLAGLEEGLRARHGSFENVWFMGLLELAREKGALPSSLWIWLRPADRTLFYALNQTGGSVAWAEAAGAFSHYGAENKTGLALRDPRVEPALESLAASLDRKSVV
jgi:hypothetical protein